MSIVVQKFGGTSLSDSDKMKNVADAVIREKNLGNDVITIVSAMGHTTDALIKLANEISSTKDEREMDCFYLQANKFLQHCLQWQLKKQAMTQLA